MIIFIVSFFNKNFESLNFKPFQKELVQSFDKCLTSPNPIIKAASESTLKKLVQLFGVNILNDMKNLPKQLKEELES